MTRDEYVETLKATALDLGKRAVLRQLAASVPMFSGGFFGWLAGMIVGKVLQVAIQQTEFGAFFLYIDMRVDEQGRDFEAAATAYHAAKLEDKPKYEKAYLDSFYKLASLKS